MDDPGLFALFGAALGLGTPWQVMSVAFDLICSRRTVTFE